MYFFKNIYGKRTSKSNFLHMLHGYFPLRFYSFIKKNSHLVKSFSKGTVSICCSSYSMYTGTCYVTDMLFGLQSNMHFCLCTQLM